MIKDINGNPIDWKKFHEWKKINTDNEWERVKLDMKQFSLQVHPYDFKKSEEFYGVLLKTAKMFKIKHGHY